MRLSDALKQKRSDLLDRLEKLAKLAESEQRLMTDTEQAGWEAGMSEIADMDKKIKAQEQAEELLRGATGRIITPGSDRPRLREGEVRAYRGREPMFAEHANSELSFGRLVRAMARRDWRGAEGEQRALGEATPGGGGVLVPVELFGSVIDRARNLAVMMRAGALSFDMASQTLDVARLLTDPVSEWKAENAPANEAELTFDKLVYRARTLICLVRSSVELSEDAPNFAEAVENAVAQSIALELDRVGLNGTGIGEQPLGIMQTPGLATVLMGADGAVPANYKPFVAAQGRVLEANETPTAWIHAPRTATDLANLSDTTNQPMLEPPLYSTLPKYISNQMPTTLAYGTSGAVCSNSLVGDFSKCAYGVRNSGQLEITREGGDGTFRNLQLLIRLYLRADFHVLRIGAFAAVTGIKDVAP